MKKLAQNPGVMKKPSEKYYAILRTPLENN
jgi:hypothetical protein